MGRDSSLFTTDEIDLELDAELLPVGGATSDCYRVKLYGKWFFLKRLKPQHRSSPRYLALMRKEFETGFQLEHPHLANYVRLGADFIIMEYVDGLTLTDFTATLPEFFNSKDDTLRLLTQLLDTIAYLHSHQVVHLDLKPDNIMVTRIGNDVKIVDLGFCYTDTYPDTTGGTERYAAPEQFGGSGKVDERADIYAFGRILEQLPCASRYRDIIARCTAADPARRYPTARAVLDALRRRHSRPRRLAVTAAVIIALFALAAALYLGLRPASGTHASQPSPADTAAIASADTAAFHPPVADKPAEAAPPTAAALAPAPPTAAEPATQSVAKPDINTLHNKIAAWLTPRFEREFGAYRDSASSQIDKFAYSNRFADFRSRQYRRYINENGTAPYEERDISREYSKVLLALDHDLCTQMKRNSPAAPN